MKKTLFAVAALALCGTAVAGEYNASDFKGDVFASNTFGRGAEVVFKVDQTVELLAFDSHDASSVTLNFVGANTFSSEYDLDMPNLVSIMGDDAAKASWGETLLSSMGVGDFKSILLATSSYSTWWPPTREVDPTLDGKSVGDLITLGNAEVTYVGYFGSYMEANDALLNNGSPYSAAVALVGDSESLYLHGLATTPTTPEPATATLSLMALAGLCARRRRK